MIKAILMDVDGVLTDNKKYYSSDGKVTKVFSVEDGEAIKRAQRHGITIGIVTADVFWTGIYTRTEDLGIDKKYVFMTTMDKITAVNVFCKNYRFDNNEVCFIGNSIEDVSAMSYCGMAAAPADASQKVLHLLYTMKPSFISTKKGGDGAVREIIEHILEEQRNL